MFGTKSLRHLLLGKEYHPLNRIYLSQKNLLSNYNYLSSLQEAARVAPVLKSNAYGHGLAFIAKILDPVNAPFFCVDSLYEAYDLLRAKIKTPILIMGYIGPKSLEVKRLPFSYSVYDENLLRAISKFQPEASVHIFVDTGMHREGVPVAMLSEFLRLVKKTNIKVDGLMSHLALGGEDMQTKKQLKEFKKAKKILAEFGFHPQFTHINASVGLLNKVGIQEKVTTVNRAGKALYGTDPRGENVHLKPVLKLCSQIVQIKFLSKGDFVGYEATYIAKEKVILAVIPLGYYEGVDRRLSNKGVVKVNGIDCPIIGRVSMNMTTIDVSRIQRPFVGQEVVVYSDDARDKNSVLNTAKICETIPYEIISHLERSMRREII